MEPFVKRLNFAPIDFKGEPVVYFLPKNHDKIASVANPEIMKWVEEHPHGSDFERVICTALGSFEGYGANVNGDGFHENHLLSPPKGVYLRNKPYTEPIYRTFVDFSRLFNHHRNRPHDQSLGEVPHTVYNPKMRRVEAVIDIYTDDPNNQEILNDLDRNIYPAVSMGFRCIPGDVCVCPNTLINTDLGYVKIKDLKPGNKCYTHYGNLKLITETFRRVSPKNLINLDIYGEVDPLQLTDNHPIWCIKQENVQSKQFRYDKSKMEHPDINWIIAEDVKEGDFLIEPLISYDTEIDYYIDEDIAYLLGIYAGDGSIFIDKRRKNGAFYYTSFSLNIDDFRVYKKIIRLCIKHKFNFTVSFKSRNDVRIDIREDCFGRLCERLVGIGSHGKRLHKSLFNWSEDCKKSFIGGYIDSDGCISIKEKSHYSARINSVNKMLLNSVKYLCWGIGCLPAFGKENVVSGYISGITSYKLWFSIDEMIKITRFSEKIPNNVRGSITNKVGKRFLFEKDGVKFIAKKIRKKLKIQSPCSYVYNLAIEDDESYIASNVSVHNCSICLNYDNPFPSRLNYCDHLKNHMLEFDPVTGRLIYAINNNGYFFDLSIVKRPADRIAWGMRRVIVPVKADINSTNRVPVNQIAKEASKMHFTEYSSKLAEDNGYAQVIKSIESENKLELQKEANELISKVIQRNPDPDFKRYGLPLVYRTDLPIEKSALDYFARSYNLNDITSTFVGVGIIPKPQEFQRMVLVNTGNEKLADELDKDHLVFDYRDTNNTDDSLDCNIGRFNFKLAAEMRDLGILDNRSYYAPFLMKRAAMIKEAISVGEFFSRYPLIRNLVPTKKYPEDYPQRIVTQGVNQSAIGQYYQRYPNPVMSDGRYVSPRPGGTTVIHKNNPLIPLAILGSLYVGAKWITGFSKQGPLGKAMSQHPAVAAGAFGAAAALSWAIGRLGIKHPEKTSSIGINAAKTLGSLGKDYILHLLSGVALSYGIASRAEKKREYGLQPNIVEEAFEKRPLVGSAITALAIGTGLNLASKLATEELTRFEDDILINDHIIAEYPHDYIDKMARRSLIVSALKLL